MDELNEIPEIMAMIARVNELIKVFDPVMANALNPQNPESFQIVVNNDELLGQLPELPEEDLDNDVIFVSQTVPVIDLSDYPDTIQPGFGSQTQPKCSGFDCPICMDNLIDKNPTSTICGHIFCADCIRISISTRQKCPICSKFLKPEQTHRVFLQAE